MLSFRPNQKIVDKDLLFGRNKRFQQLDRVLNNIYRGTNCQLQGEKRFGKTSILNCIQTVLKSKKEKTYVPIFLDFKKHSAIQGTSNVYRFVLSLLIQELTKLNLFDQPIVLRSKNIQPTPIAEDAFDALLQIDGLRVEGIFEDFILKFAEDYDINFILLIDEYEHLLSKSLDEPVGFMLIRNLADEYLANCIPLTYVIAGSKEWNLLCTKLGSPELNNQGAGIIYVGAIQEEDYDEMFDYYYEEESPCLTQLNRKDIYLQSGGIPYYAKKIAESLITENVLSPNLLNNEFRSILDNLEEEEKLLISRVVKGQKIKEGNLVKNLTDRGILKMSNGFAVVNGQLLTGYFMQKFNTDEESSIEAKNHQLLNHCDTIYGLIERINQNFRNKGKGNYLFEPIATEHSHKKILSKLCCSAKDFAELMDVVYFTIYERTAQNGSKKARIPAALKEDPIIHRLDSLRQEYRHLTSSKEYKQRGNQLKRGELFNYYLGSASEPDNEQFADLQTHVLRDFISLLSKVQRIIC